MQARAERLARRVAEGWSGRKTAECFVLAAFFALAGLVFQQSGTSLADQGAAGGGAMMNAALFPEILAWGLVGLGMLRVAWLVLLPDSGQETSSEAIPPATLHAGAEEEEERRGALLLRALASTALFVAYVLVLRSLGYHLATPILMSALYAVLGVRPLAAVAFGVLTSLVMSFVFEFGMGVILPVGRFGIGF